VQNHFLETFKINVGIPDLSKKIYLIKNALFKKLKSLRNQNKKNEEIRAKSKTELF